MEPFFHPQSAIIFLLFEMQQSLHVFDSKNKSLLLNIVFLENMFISIVKKMYCLQLLLTVLFSDLSLLVFPPLILLFRRFQVGDTIPA